MPPNTPLKDFFLASNPAINKDAQYIISTRPPVAWCQVWRFKNGQGFAHFIQGLNGLSYEVVAGYCIVLVHCGVFNGATYRFSDAAYLQQAAQFYYQYQITPNLKYYERYRTA